MLGGVLQLALQVPALRRIGMLPRIGVASPPARFDGTTRPPARSCADAARLLGVSVAQISLLINTQIASHLAAGSVSWLNNADRLMEFPTAMLGVALGVVLMPQLAAARAAKPTRSATRRMLDWGLRLVVLLAIPCAVALLVFAAPLVATLFHYGAFKDSDVDQVRWRWPATAAGCWAWWRSRCWRPATTPARTCARRCASPWALVSRSC
jgi:putative peptidoglycan lipid II flippase